MSLEIIRSPTLCREQLRTHKHAGRRIGLVPTMGFLHEGHMSLLREARERCDLLVMSLFINPTQFGAGEDLDRYPRDEAGDEAKAESCGVDLIFSPEASEMYPEGFQTSIRVPDLAGPMCGASRPGHFEGVATVVAKLFNICQPDVAVFGQKDFQQLAIIRRMVADLDFGIEIVGGPIVREDDGLAMSSRNVYLSPEERQQALSLYRGLCAAGQRLREGATDKTTILAAADAVIGASPLAKIDYLELRDAETLAPIEAVQMPAVLAVAARFGRTRLIDNLLLTP